MNYYDILLTLAGETTVDVSLLAEDTELIRMIKDKRPYLELLDYVNDNY
jgi:hypothetical protein